MAVDIEINQFTPCLLDTETGMFVDTTFSLASAAERRELCCAGWLFDWLGQDLQSSEIYKLTLKDNEEIEGLVAIENEPNNMAYHLRLAESAPCNRVNRRYEGVGGHLFAIAAKLSLDAGYGGFVYFEAKNQELVQYYMEALGAVFYGMPHPYSMALEEEAAIALLEQYTLYGGA